MLRYFAFLFSVLFIFINSCAKEDDQLFKSPTCKISSLNIIAAQGMLRDTIQFLYLYDDEGRLIIRDNLNNSTDSVSYIGNSNLVDKIFRLGAIPGYFSYYTQFSYNSSNQVIERRRFYLDSSTDPLITIDSFYYYSGKLVERKGFKSFRNISFPVDTLTLNFRMEYFFTENELTQVNTYQEGWQGQPTIEEFYSDFTNIKNPFYQSFFIDKLEAGRREHYHRKYVKKENDNIVLESNNNYSNERLNEYNYPLYIENSPVMIDYICN